MRKIKLKRASGFGLLYEKEDIKFDKVTYSRNKVVTLEEMKPQILNEDLQSPKVFYTKYSNIDTEGIFKEKKIKVNLISIPSNVAGIEYVKTKATQTNSHNKVLEIICGSGLLLIQNFNEETASSEVILVKIKSTEKIVIPAKFSYSLVNNRNTPLIVLEFMSARAKNNVVLDEMRGMAYYIIKKNAKQEIVRNPLYRIVETKNKVDWEIFYKKCNITPKTPFSRQVLRKYEKYDWLLNASKSSNLPITF